MLSTFKRRIAKLESAGKKVGQKSFDDFCTEVHDYVRRTGVCLDEAMTRFVRDVSTADLKRFIAEAKSAGVKRKTLGGGLTLPSREAHAD